MLRNFYNNKIATIIIIISVIVIGVLQFLDLPIALYPRTSKPKVRAGLSVSAISPLEFQERYGTKIESALRSIPKVEKVISEYSSGQTNYDIEFAWGIESDQAKEDVKNVLSGYESQFPLEWGRFWIYFAGEHSSQIIVVLNSRSIPYDDLVHGVKSSLVPQLESVEGLSWNWVTDFEQKYIKIELNPNAVTYLGLTFDSIKSALKGQEFNKSLGVLSFKGGGSFEVRADLKNQSLDDLQNTIIANINGKTIKLKDIAKISLEQDIPERVFKANGQKTLILVGGPKPDANLKQVADDYVKVIQTYAKQIDPASEVKLLLNPADFINAAIDNVISAVVIGMLIATLVIFLFLRSFRNTIVIAIAIPLSLMGGFILMRLLGIEVNLISLGAMALATGMVVDGSIVVLENIIRHLELKQPTSVKERLEIILAAVNEVRNAVIASLLTTIIVFAPLPFTSPLTAAVLGDLAIVMVCVLSISVIVTLLFVPSLTLLLGVGCQTQIKRRGIYRCGEWFNRFFDRCQKVYLFFLEYLLLNRRAALGFLAIILVTLASGVWLMITQIPREVMATPSTDKLFLFLDFQVDDLELKDVENIVAIYEKNLLAQFQNDITHTVSHSESKHGAWIMAFLKDQGKIKSMKEKFEAQFNNTPLVRFHIWPWVPTALEIPNPPLIKVLVNGKGESERRNLLDKVTTMLKDHDNLGRVNNDPSTKKADFLNVKINKELINRLHFDQDSALPWSNVESQVYQLLSSSLSQQTLYQMNLNGADLALKMGFPEHFFKTATDLENMLIRVQNRIIPIRAFADISYVQDWNQYYREDSREVMFVEAWPKESFGGNKRQLEQQLKEKISNDPDIDKNKIAFLDTQTEINENIHSLTIALVIAILLIAIVITLQFPSLLQTAIILLAVPLGFIGVAFSLWMFSSTVSINSMLGLILLAGTAVNNSIVFIDFFNKIMARSEQAAMIPALLETAKLRLRPIMITTLTTILGMLPIALGFGSGGEILQPLGIAVSGGLWVSTLLTIFVVPLAIFAAQRLKTTISEKYFLRKVISSLFLGAVIGSCLISEQAHSQGIELSVDQAVKAVLERHGAVREAEINVRVAEFERRGQYGNFLPTLTLGRKYSEQFVEYQNVAANEDATRQQKFGTSSITVEEKLISPYRLSNDFKIATNNKEIALVDLDLVRQELIAQVRTQYFKAKAAAILLANAEQNKKLAEKNLEISRMRYQSGFIDSSDAKRTEIQSKKAFLDIESKNELYLQELAALLALASDQRHAEAVSLITNLPNSFKYFAYDERQLQNQLGQLNSAKTRKLELVIENAELNIQNAKSNFFPTLSLGATYTRAQPLQNPDYQPLSPVFFVAAEWQLFSGGRDYYNYSKNVALKAGSAERLTQQQRDLDLEILRFTKTLINLKRKFLLQQESVVVWQQISASSQARFQKGLIDSKQVNDDFSTYLAEQESLVEITLDIIKVVAELERATGNPDIFSKFN